MNQTLTLDRSPTCAAAPSRGAGLYEKLVMKTFARFQHGGLRMTLPDGGAHVLGAKGETVTAELRILRRADFFRRCALYGNIGFGEAYVEGDWETDDITGVVAWFIENIRRTPGTNGSSAQLAFVNALKFINRLRHKMRLNSLRNSRKNIAEHYDLGNDFYKLWLDESMTYSAARFTHEGQSLEEAQTAKYDALCRKLRLQPGDHVLEIGCGWGGFSCHAAKHYECRVTALTISEEQRKFAAERVAREGLTGKVEIRLQDYRLVKGKFDKIASIEMLEAVGDEYLETYFAKCHEVLKPDGLLAFQVITVPDSRHHALRKGVDWIQKHIFPGSLLLSIGRANEAIARTGDLFMLELEDFGSSYAKTMRLWFERFNQRLHDVKALGFNDTFIRKWNFYLQYCEAAFATRNISVVQACYTRPNNPTLRKSLA
ncbi:MAG: cyclopropane-fatty-acyl-phospholipid synthase family protein [Verrucomicrobiaceae bacterium]